MMEGTVPVLPCRPCAQSEDDVSNQVWADNRITGTLYCDQLIRELDSFFQGRYPGL